MISQTFLTAPTDHAPFSPSQPMWLRYSDEELINSFKNKHRSELGTEIHEWASGRINLGARVTSAAEALKDVKYHIYLKYAKAIAYKDILLKNLEYVPDEVWPTAKDFINDSIGFRMESEKRIGYSDLFWGTADAIKHDGKNIMVFDLKTGIRPAKTEQLLIYAALFCLMDNINPLGKKFETRIYQGNDILIEYPEAEEIKEIANAIVHKDQIINKFMGE